MAEFNSKNTRDAIQSNQNIQKLDVKDYKILKELDINFRQSFSKIGKKVGLSKNSVALRFEKLKPYMLHNLTAINNEILGQTMVKIYYSFDFYNESVENKIIDEIKKHKNILWAAKYFGVYDIVICLFIKNIHELINCLTKLEEKFADKINQKEVEIISKEFRFRYNFIHKEPINKIFEVKPTEKRVILKDIEKKILLVVRHNPRMSLVSIAEKSGLTPKTVANKLKYLERKGVIIGYFMTLDTIKFNHNIFQLLVQIKNSKKISEFESYLCSLKNINCIFKMLGLWDYELDFIYSNMTDLQKQIEIMKEKFPNIIRKIEILSIGKRIVTNKENFLM